MGLDLTTFASALKVHYTPDRIAQMTYKNNPFLALVSKFEDMGGEKYAQPVRFANPQSRSATFATAQSNAATSNSQVTKFEVTRVKDYGVVTIDGETIEASKKDVDSFFRAKTMEIDGIMMSTSRSLATALFRDGYGSIGQVANSGLATTTLTLGNSTANDPSSVANFEKGMKLVFSSSNDGAALRAAGATLTVTGVDRSAGTVTLSAALNTIAALAQNDYIFIQGDRQDSVTPSRLKVAGLEAWCPASAPSSTAFFGVDRTQDSRLGGVRFDGSSYPVEEALIEASILVGREGGVPDVCFMNHKKFGELVKSLGSKVNYCDVRNEKVGFGFRGLEIYTPTGTVKVVPDHNCPTNRAFLLQMDTWKMGSLGGVPRILNFDGLEALRQASADGVEIRVGYYGNLICDAPGWNCAVTL